MSWIKNIYDDPDKKGEKKEQKAKRKKKRGNRGEFTDITHNVSGSVGQYIDCYIDRVINNIVFVCHGEKEKNGASSFKSYPMRLRYEVLKIFPSFLGKEDITKIKDSLIRCSFEEDRIIMVKNEQGKTFVEFYTEQKN